MPGKSPLPQRRPIRLPEYDYAQPGAYFVTITTHHRECLFGEITGDSENAAVRLTPAGKTLMTIWHELPKHYAHVKTGEMAVMPDHFHGIVYLMDHAESRGEPLTEVIRAYKSFSAKRINAINRTAGKQVWQRGYFERIIRSEEELWNTLLYIRANPQKWQDEHGIPENWRG